MADALKTRGIKYLNIETWFLFAPPITISGYAPAKESFDVWGWAHLTGRPRGIDRNEKWVHQELSIF